MNDWMGAVYLLGAAAGYFLFFAAQPLRGTFARAYGITRDYPMVWMVAATFAIVRLTLDTVALLATGKVSPDEFVRLRPTGVLPLVQEVLAPALDAVLDGWLRLVTYFVDVWPLSVVMAVYVLFNIANTTTGLWRSPGNEGMAARSGRWTFASIVFTAALLHLAETVLRLLPASWLPEIPAAVLECGRWGSEFFLVTGGLFVQAWIMHWALRPEDERFRESTFLAVLQRFNGFFYVILACVAARIFWEDERFGEIRVLAPRRVWLAAGLLAALVAIRPLVRLVGGSGGFWRNAFSGDTWSLRSGIDAFWWLVASGANLFLLHLCGLSMARLAGTETWISWVWLAFYAFFQSALYVWLFGALVLMVDGAIGQKSTPRRAERPRRRNTC